MRAWVATAGLFCLLVAAHADAASEGRVLRPPLSFEENRGQFAPEIAFVARLGEYSVALSPRASGLLFLSRAPGSKPVLLELAHRAREGVASPQAPRGEDLQKGRVNYFIGSDPARWHTRVPTFRRVRWPGVYPGVDVVLHADPAGAQLEVDFEVAPGAREAPIAWKAGPGASLRESGDGSLELRASHRSYRLRAPRSLERTDDGATQPLASRYERRGGTYGFHLAARHAERALVIDPIIQQSGAIGSTQYETIDSFTFSDASSAIVGQTSATDFPVTNGSTLDGPSDGYVVKLSADRSVVYESYLGGSGADEISAVALDASGNLVLGGFTSSADFPRVSPIQAAPGGGQDAFVTKLSPDGSSMLASTYFGGSATDQLTALALDGAGNIYATGNTTSNDFPTHTPAQGARSGAQDAFVFKLSEAGTAVVFSTYLGGTSVDLGQALGVASDGSAVVVGQTQSTNFPVLSAFQGTNAGGVDAFVTRFSPAGAIAFSTYLGGASADAAQGVALAPDGSCSIAGYTDSATFPSLHPLQAWVGSRMGFFTQLSSSGGLLRSAFLWSGQATGVGEDPIGGQYVLGDTDSSTYPTLDSLMPYGGGAHDLLLIHLTSGATVGTGTIDLASYLGGNADDLGGGIAASSGGAVVVSTNTQSLNYPVVADPAPSPFNPGYAWAFLSVVQTAPMLQQIDVASGPADGGTRFTLTGENFRASDQVTFDGVPASDVQRSDQQHLSGVAPPHAPGTVDIAVKRSSQVSTLVGAFTYAQSVVTQVVPPSAPHLPDARTLRVGWSCHSAGGAPQWSGAAGLLLLLFRGVRRQPGSRAAW